MFFGVVVERLSLRAAEFRDVVELLTGPWQYMWAPEDTPMLPSRLQIGFFAVLLRVRVDALAAGMSTAARTAVAPATAATAIRPWAL
jgi:hypothetical protein